MTTAAPEADASLRAVFGAVSAFGVVAVAAGLALGGLRFGVGVLGGALLGLGNLWLIARVVAAFLGAANRGWALIAVVKMTALFATFWLLTRAGLDVLPIVLGLGALPLGVAVGQVFVRVPVSERG